MGTDLGTAGSLAALFHDAAAPASGDEVAWLGERLARCPGNVLDLACGAGRLLVPLARAGHAMHGIDRSAAALALCRDHLQAERAGATLVRQALADVNLPFRFVAAYAAAGAFQSITDGAAAAHALQRVRAHLLPPALLMLELFVPSPSSQRIAAPLVELRTASLPDGSRIALRSETVMHADARIARSQHRYVHRRGTARLAEETQASAITWYSREDIEALLRAHGFTHVGVEPCAWAHDDADRFVVTAHAA